MNHEIELARLQDRQLGWLGALEDPARVNARLAMDIRQIRPLLISAEVIE